MLTRRRFAEDFHLSGLCVQSGSTLNDFAADSRFLVISWIVLAYSFARCLYSSKSLACLVASSGPLSGANAPEAISWSCTSVNMASTIS